MIVYIVTTNPHGERKIKAVFEDRDQAIYCCALCDQEDAMIEEWDTEAIQITGHKKPLAEWTVFINGKGEAIDAELRYTFTEILKFSEDMDGSGAVYLTVDKDTTEAEAKTMAVEYWEQLKK